MKCMEPFRTGNRNERGERLLDLGEENKLVVGSLWGNCEIITKVDIGSDHRMVRARVEINKK